MSHTACCLRADESPGEIDSGATFTVKLLNKGKIQHIKTLVTVLYKMDGAPAGDLNLRVAHYDPREANETLYTSGFERSVPGRQGDSSAEFVIEETYDALVFENATGATMSETRVKVTSVPIPVFNLPPTMDE